MLALGIAVVGGGVAFAGDGTGTDAPSVIVPGVVSDFPVDSPTVNLSPTDPNNQGPVMSAASVWEWT